MSKSSKIRVGLVGAGEWARNGHVPALREVPEFELVAVATSRPVTAREAAARFAIPHACSDATELIGRDDVDLVVVNNRAPDHLAVTRAALDAGKHVYCEWPLTTRLADSEQLLASAERAGVRHVVGLQRRMAGSSRHLRELIAEGYVGTVRSVHLHVTEPTFAQRRASVLGFTIPGENFSSVFSIYGGHYLDLILTAVGGLDAFSSVVTSQFPWVTLTESGENVESTAPDQMLLSGTLARGGVISAHVEGGKRSGYGVRIDITGADGDLRLTYDQAFGATHDGELAGARHGQGSLVALPIPERLQWLSSSNLRGSVRELGNLYAAFARDMIDGTQHTPSFHDAVRLHALLDAIESRSLSPSR
ncbi:Gfo/Idh/MocA family protein [Chondromyces crocatus]|uniref:Oxidoreductase n=1 Tax=Chondromyces crocatus TaxID=52 RepID=A0A0K1EB62_CHOCO|nr:Gfo/Idh/MocA family oxidoreductase [Chondromyces crocatus]AKT38116.1 oxidoreductase [Chondromyces crocatus]